MSSQTHTDSCQRLEQSVINMAALLEININLHHFSTLDAGVALSDSAVAGLSDITRGLCRQASENVEAVFAEKRSQKLTAAN